MVPETLDVIRAWGFTFKTKAFNWVKSTKHGKLHWGMGFWTRANAEDVWLASRGAPKRISRGVHQIVTAPVGEHSVKPEEVAHRIERLVAGPYLELFARRTRPNWTCWGDEVPIGNADTRLLDEIFAPLMGNRRLAAETRALAIAASCGVRPAITAPVAERLVGTTSPRVIVYIYADGTRAWRYAAGKTLRYEGADEMQFSSRSKRRANWMRLFRRWASTSSTT